MNLGQALAAVVLGPAAVVPTAQETNSAVAGDLAFMAAALFMAFWSGK